MSNATYKFDIVDGVVTTMYRLHHGDWKADPFEANEVAVYDAVGGTVSVSETYPTLIQIKTYVLQGDVYLLDSERFTDLAGVPILSDPHHGGFDDSNNDGFDDDDMDLDGSEDDHLSSSDDNGHRLHGRGGDDILDGSDDDDAMDGGSGDDDLSGGSGRDRMAGGVGDDSLSGEDGDDKLAGDDGADHIRGGGGDDALKGGKGDDDLDGGVGDDSVDGGSGNDVFLAGLDAGNDRYHGGSGIDSVSYAGALSGVTVNLAKGFAVSSDGGDAAGIGTDKLRDIENATGGDGNDTLIGNSAANVLDGGNGDDLIIGGSKADTLSGGAGKDSFKFLKVSDSSVVAHDVITDFTAGDLIDLSAIDAQKGLSKNDSFSFVGDSSAVTADNANGALWFENGMLYGSTDADIDAEFQLELTGVVALTEASIVL